MTAATHDHDHHHDIRVPRPLLVGVAILLCAVTALALLSRFTGIGALKPVAYEPVASLSLQFRDEAGGAVGVYDAGTGEQVFLFQPETGGFVRTTLRALALDRRRIGIGAEPPFNLVRTANGPLFLEDPSTGKSISLDAFGGGNAATFEQLFAAAEGTAS